MGFNIGRFGLPLGMLGLVIALGGAVPASVASGSSTTAPARLDDLARAAGPLFSEAGLNAAFADMDPSMRALADQFAPLPEAGLAGLDASGEIRLPGAPAFSASALQGLSWDAARLVNASIPFSHESNAPARPFQLNAGPEDRARAVQCLAEAVYYEAGFEPLEGQQAVAQVVLNRLRHPVYPKTVCGVVYQGHELPTGCQFTFTCDGALARPPVPEVWKRAREVAERALAGYVAKAVGEATHYHADYVVPYWLPSLSKMAKVGTHIFYRWSGSFGAPSAFTGRYAGAEPLMGGMLALASADTSKAPLASEEKAPMEIVVATAQVSAQVEAPIALHQTETMALSAPTGLAIKVPKHEAPFAIRPNCVNSTLGNCANF